MTQKYNSDCKRQIIYNSINIKYNIQVMGTNLAHNLLNSMESLASAGFVCNNKQPKKGKGL